MITLTCRTPYEEFVARCFATLRGLYVRVVGGHCVSGAIFYWWGCSGRNCVRRVFSECSVLSTHFVSCKNSISFGFHCKNRTFIRCPQQLSFFSACLFGSHALRFFLWVDLFFYNVQKPNGSGIGCLLSVLRQLFEPLVVLKGYKVRRRAHN